MSNKLFTLLSKYTNDIEIASIDECYLDYTKIKHLYGNEIEFAHKIKKEIYDKLGFTVNIGIANNKLCAKMASDFLKPYKVHTLYDNEVKEKMYPLPI
jgi:DNA polymerase-4